MEPKSVRHDLTCVICLKLLFNTIITNCGHNYHGHCIRKWIENFKSEKNKSASCPTCRESILFTSENRLANNLAEEYVKENFSSKEKEERKELIDQLNQQSSYDHGSLNREILIPSDDSSSNESSPSPQDAYFGEISASESNENMLPSMPEVSTPPPSNIECNLPEVNSVGENLVDPNRESLNDQDVSEEEEILQDDSEGEEVTLDQLWLLGDSSATAESQEVVNLLTIPSRSNEPRPHRIPTPSTDLDYTSDVTGPSSPRSNLYTPGPSSEIGNEVFTFDQTSTHYQLDEMNPLYIPQLQMFAQRLQALQARYLQQQMWAHLWYYMFRFYQQTLSGSVPPMIDDTSDHGTTSTTDNDGAANLEEARKNSRQRKSRTVFDDHQVKMLQQQFNEKPYLNKFELEALSKAVGLAERQVGNWFTKQR